MTVFKDILRQHLEKTIAPQELAQWFDPLAVAVDEAKGIMRVSFPHSFFGQWFMDARKEIFEFQTFSFIRDITIVYEDGSVFKREKSGTAPPARGIPKFSGIPEKDARPAEYRDTLVQRAENPFGGESVEHLPAESSSPLPAKHRFDTFIVNRKNDFPLAVAHEAVEKALSPPFTPFVIYGQSGSGKTHLIGAMANALIARNPNLPFYYGGIDYLNKMLFSPSRSAPVKEQVVFIDDIQRVYHSPELQDALAALIDTFHASRRLLVLCADAHPAGSSGLSGKLIARLTGGLVVELKRPDLDIRRQYLQQKNTSENLGLSKDHILTLAQRHQDIRSINGLLTRISAYRSLVNRHDGDLDKFFEHSLGDNPERRILTPDSIIEAVARHYSVSAEDLPGKKRDKSLGLARPVAMLLCRELLGLSLVQVGKIFGGRDHSSILYSLQKIKKIQASDKDTHMHVSTLKQLCLTRRE